MSMFPPVHYIIFQADVIRVKVGYPVSPDTDNPHSIAQYYNNLKVDKDGFFENILSSACVFENFLLKHSVMCLFYKGRVKSSGNGYNLGVSEIPIHGKCTRRQSMHTSTHPRTRLSSLPAFFNRPSSPRIGGYISAVGDTQLTILLGLTICHTEHLAM